MNKKFAGLIKQQYDPLLLGVCHDFEKTLEFGLAANTVKTGSQQILLPSANPPRRESTPSNTHPK